MKSPYLLISFLFLMFQLAAQDIVIGEKQLFSSQILGEEREIYLALPEGYEQSNESYPIIYILDEKSCFSPITMSWAAN